MTSAPIGLRLAQAEVLDAVGHGVRLIDVHAWPLTIGRALDNDIALPDPHVAAHHATLAPDAEGRLRLSVGDTRNGVRIEHGGAALQLRANEQAPLLAGARLHLGHSQLLLRLPQDPLATELPLLHGLAAGPRWLVPGMAMLALVWLLAARWVGSDADTKWNEYLAPVLAGGGVLFLWCLVWGLASKLFTGRFTLMPHLRTGSGVRPGHAGARPAADGVGIQPRLAAAQPPAPRGNLRRRRRVADAASAPGAAQAHARGGRAGWPRAPCSASPWRW